MNIVSTASQSLGSVFECARNKNPYNALFHSLEDPLYLSNCVPTAPSNLRQKRRKNTLKIYLHKKQTIHHASFSSLFLFFVHYILLTPPIAEEEELWSCLFSLKQNK